MLLTDDETGEIIQQWLDGKIEAKHVSQAIAKAQAKKVVKWIEREGRTGYRYTDDDTKVITWEYDTKCDNEIMIDLGDWQALLDEVK